MLPRRNVSAVLAVLSVLAATASAAQAGNDPTTRPYTIVDTGQVRCYNNTHEIAYPKHGQAFFGQDAQYAGHAPHYRDNRDGTVSDLVTGLMWTADPGKKVTYAQAVAGAARCRTAGHRDWRLPTIKELYSLILFSGQDPDPRETNAAKYAPFIDTRFFQFRYGNPADGDRIIDSQFATSTRYVSTTMNCNATMFGVNFADGRIKGYPTGRIPGRGTKTFFALYVRGNPKYGRNDFVDNGDGTITDRATGLTWMQVDSGHLKAGAKRDGRLNWAEALVWAEKLRYAGHDDWRLPTVKELQSIVDYRRCPATTKTAAIDPVFKTTRIRVEQGRQDYPFFWSSTTHASKYRAHQACYVAFGSAYGYMRSPRTGRKTLMDVHGAGAQRSDPKSGDPSKLPQGFGPQGDVQRIYNFVRCVRGGLAKPRTSGPKVELTAEKVRNTGPEGGDAKAGFIRRLDRDGDGKVSRKEFDGPAEHFRDFDRNGDGYISGDEAPTGPPSTDRGRRR